MSLYAEHIRVTLGGTLDPTSLEAEIWSCTVNALPVVGDPAAFDCETYLTESLPNFVTWYSYALNGLLNVSHLTYVKCNPIDATGHYASAGVSHRIDNPANTAGGAGAKQPQVISLVTSWTTAISRGPASKGRVFLPNNTWGSAGYMIVPDADAASAVTAGKQLLDAVANTAGTAKLRPIIASGLGGQTEFITGVRVGNVLDAQLRRRDALKERYTASTWP